MSNYGDEEEAYLMESMAGMSKLMAPYFIDVAPLKLFGVAVGRYLSISMFPASAALFLWLAYVSELHSFWNLVDLELSSGCFFFAVAPVVVFLGRSYRWQVPLAGLIAAVVLLWLAHDCETVLSEVSPHACEFLRAALIEYAVALLLVVGLELAMSPWLRRLEEKQRKLSEEVERNRRENENIPEMKVL